MRFAAVYFLFSGLFLLGQASMQAQEPSRRKEFPPGAVRGLQDLPAGRLRDDIGRLPALARDRAVAWLGNLHFTEGDTRMLRVDASGGVYFADHFEAPQLAAASADVPLTQAASVPVSPFPASLVFHSRPGAPNVIYLNFSGEDVTGTAWNTDVGRTTIPAVAFSTDSDLATFTDAEQLAIRRIWQRVAEDYAPFNVDVTTERPSSFTSRTAHALITRHTDANGAENPASTSGGVAYVGVFAGSSYSKYRPAWIYCDNLGNQESYVAEAASHEVGHNLGLTHDGKTDGTDYYGGHGSGETSWGPIMGTGYNRNVSQWSKGEYYLANNTQDDLATIAGRLSYRTDDHGNSFGSATALSISAAGTITSTTPEGDPGNTNTVNKGVIERSTDLDVFSLTAGTGPLSISVKPWIVPGALTRGGNVDLVVELYSASGQLLLTNNAATSTTGTLQTNVTDGVYYLLVKSTGVGNPTNSSPSGYTGYASIGQYFITGTVVPSGVVIPPGAELSVSDIAEPGIGAKTFTVTYSDDVAIDVSTIGNDDIRVSGPNGYERMAVLKGLDVTSNGSPRVSTYEILPPDNVWSEADEGVYSIAIGLDAVKDTQGASVPARTLGTFTVTVPRAIYFASMDSNPGWSLEGSWQFGSPRYTFSGPAGGVTGTNIMAYNLSGNYENRLSAVYATTPPINCSGSSTLTLKFQRWLRVRSGDTAVIEISTDNANWSPIWSNGRSVLDNAWQSVQYTLPSWANGSSSLRIRWGMASGQSQNDIGWNLDDLVLLGDGALDTSAPSAVLNAANLVAGGSPVHTFNVSYADDTAVSVASIGDSDLLVVGPNGTNTVQFDGVDLPTDGSPRIAVYSLPAPNGFWQSSDNGEYLVYLQENEVTDTANNAMEPALLGSFTVAISTNVQSLVVEPLSVTVPEGGAVDFSIRLAERPSADVVVSARVASGDADIEVPAGFTHTFTPDTWNIPVPVHVTAAVDADRENGTATIICESAGLAVVNVSATEQDTTPLPPVLSITSPVNGYESVSATPIHIAAEASDDGAIISVEFFANGTSLGQGAAAPYSIDVTLQPGNYELTARATDDQGASTTSAPVAITVVAPNLAPSVVLTSPRSGASYDTTSPISIVADAQDDNGIASVEFFANDQLIGTSTNPVYQISATLPAGTYNIVAKATDRDGLSGTSAPVTITVQAAATQSAQVTTIARDGVLTTVTVQTETDRPHVLETTSDFHTWAPVATNTPSGNVVTFSHKGSESRGYYRVSIPQQ